jgi:hypothetical protein
MSLNDAEAALNTAYEAVERAWEELWEAQRQAEDAARKEEIKSLIVEVIKEANELSMRTKAEAEKIEAERVAKELEDAEAERKLKEEADAKKIADEKAESEREAKELAEKEEAERKAKELEDETKRNLETNTKMEKNTLFALLDAQRTLGVQTQAIEVKRAAIDGDTSVMGEVIPKGVNDIDIMGYAPMYEAMGCDIYTGVRGTYTLPFQDPIQGAKLAELSSVTKDIVTPNGTLITPKRFSVQKEFTKETIKSATQQFFDKVLRDMVKGCDRAITSEVYTKAYAGATEVATATDITKDSFDLVMAQPEVEYGGSFLASRKTFFAAKSVAIDAGSGRFLVETVSQDVLGKGTVYDGTPFWYSNLFVDAATEQYVVYGDVSKIHIADYGEVEIIMDIYTKAAEGKVVITVNKMADVALTNPIAFAKTADVDPAV